MTANRTLSGPALAMLALPVILGGPLCYLRPEGALAWAIGMFCLPATWLGIKATAKTFGKTAACAVMRAESSVDVRKVISDAMVFASLLICVPLAASLAAALGLIDAPTALALGNRPTNVLSGLFFVIWGNRMPKILTPLSAAGCDPATIQTRRRRLGWAYVLTGLTFTVIWLVLPVHLAGRIGTVLIIAGIFVPSLVMLRYPRMQTKLRQSGGARRGAR